MIQFFIIFISFSAMALNPHAGGGGNICQRRSDSKWVLLDNLELNTSNESFSTIHLPTGNLLRHDLTKLPFFPMLNRSFNVYIKTYPDYETFRVLKNVLGLLSSVEIRKSAFPLLLPDLSLKRVCKTGSLQAAGHVSYDGLIIISRASVKKLDPMNQYSFFMHEVLRGFQLLLVENAFSNLELSQWVRVLVENKLSAIDDLKDLYKIESTVRMEMRKAEKLDIEMVNAEFKRSIIENDLNKSKTLFRQLLIREILLGTQSSVRTLLLRRP